MTARTEAVTVKTVAVTENPVTATVFRVRLTVFVKTGNGFRRVAGCGRKVVPKHSIKLF